MKEFQSIAEVAKLFHLPASTLRYWDNQGIIHFQRDDKNDYRICTYQTFLDICDVSLYRSLTIPVKELKNLPLLEEQKLNQLLQRREEELQQKIEEIQQIIQMIHNKKQSLSELQQLKTTPFQVVSCQLPNIYEFSFQDKSAMDAFIHSPTQTAVYFKKPTDALKIGIFLSNHAPIIRVRDDTPQIYLKGLLKIHYDDYNKHNVQCFVQQANKLGYQTEELIGKYLITLSENGQRYDYYTGLLRINKE